MKKRWLLLGCACAVALGVAALWWPNAPPEPTQPPGIEAGSDPAPAPALAFVDAGAEPEEEAEAEGPGWLDGDVTDATGGVAQAEVEATRRETAEGCDPRTPTRSVAGGGFTIGPLCPGQHDVRASRNGLWATGVAQVYAGERARVALRLREGTRLEVRVSNRQRKPVEGARVQVQDQISGYGAVADTDAKGRVVFEGLSARAHHVSAEKEGYLDTASAERVLAPASDRLELVLEAGARVEGRVLGPDGSPLADVELRLGQRATKLGRSFDNTATAASADGGTFSIGLVRPGPYLLAARHRGFRRLEKAVHAPGPPLTLTLSRGATLDGVFLDAEGMPVPQAQVSARASDEADRVEPSYQDGGFHAEGLSAGQWTIAGMAKGADGGLLGMAIGKFAVTDEAAVFVTLELERGESISGRCVEAHGGAPAKTDVIAIEARVFKKLLLGGFRMQSAEPGSVGLANCRGTFRIDGLRPGQYRLLGCGTDVDAPTVASGATDVVLHCKRGKLTYRVVDAQGRPITGYSSYGAPEDHPDGRTVRTFEHALDEVLTIRAPGYAVLERKVKVEKNTQLDLGDLVLTKARALKGVVVDASNQSPVPGADVFYGVDGDGAFRAKSGPDGTFAFDDVGDGEATFYARHADFQPATRAVKAGEAVVELALAPGRRLRGTVVTRDGRELRDVRVVARRVGPGVEPRFSEEVDDGKWTLGGLPDGPLWLRLESTTHNGAALSGFGPLSVKADAVGADFIERMGGSTFAIAPRDDDGHPLEATVCLVPGTPSLANIEAARQQAQLFGLEGDAAQEVHGFTSVPAGRWTAVVFFLQSKFWAAPVDVNPGMPGVVTLTMPRGAY